MYENWKRERIYFWRSSRSVTHLATKSLLTSRKIKKHSSFGVKARWARRLLLSSLKLFRSMTCRSISSAMGGGHMGSEITQPAGQARLFTYKYLINERGEVRVVKVLLTYRVVKVLLIYRARRWCMVLQVHSDACVFFLSQYQSLLTRLFGILEMQ